MMEIEVRTPGGMLLIRDGSELRLPTRKAPGNCSDLVETSAEQVGIRRARDVPADDQMRAGLPRGTDQPRG